MIAFVVAGCGGAKSAYAPVASMAADTAGAAAPAQIAAEAGGKKQGDTQETWKRSQIVANTARVAVGDHEELTLRAMQANVTIDGFRARVVIDYLFANQLGRPLEGTFQLRLPEEASPHFFAFGPTTHGATAAWSQPMVIATDGDAPAPPPDSGAAMRTQILAARERAWIAPKEARMVPREQAAHAYGDVVRQRVDPALMEWAGAGVFSARVFPIAPDVLHRIVVGYDVDLVRIGGSLEYGFDVPERAPVSIVDITVQKPAQAVVSTTPPATATATKSAPPRQLYHFENPAQRTIKVRLEGAGAPLLVGGDPRLGPLFAAQVAPVLPEAAPAATGADAVFLVDTSLSSNPDRFNVWLKLLRAVLDENRGSLRRFAVLFFGVDVHWYREGFTDNTPEAVSALLAHAGTLALEGATDLGAAFAEAARPAWLGGAERSEATSVQAQPASAPASRSNRERHRSGDALGARGGHDLFLLSDGAATWGEGNLHALARTLAERRSGPLFAYQTGMAGTDVPALVHLARETGGAVFSVTGESEVARAATAHRARPWRIAGARIAGASDLLLAGRPTALFPGQTLLAVGRGALPAGAALELELERDGRRTTVTAPLAAPLASALAGRAYGQVATAQLEELEAATEGPATSYAMHFRVTGRTCSLLMLDTEADYERYGIRPEEHAFVVQTRPAGELVARTLAETRELLGDPKAAFLAMIGKLARTPGVRFTAPEPYRAMLERLPAAAFAVPTAPLPTKFHTKGQLPPPQLARLASHQLDYDAISADAQARRGAGGPGDVLKALSSLVEENPGDAVLARDVGYSAMDLGLRPQAYHLFRRVAALRPFEPQTYRAMAQALAAMGNADLALAYYEIPLIGDWDTRFGELKKIVEIDYLRLLRKIASGEARSSAPEYAKARLETLARKVGIAQADVLVTITWNTDNTDVDLHVTEPTGETCSYQNRRTRIGGAITQDVTRGYGPEMYVLPRAARGTYQVKAHYFASDRNRASARTKVYVTLFEGWGTPNERVTERVVALADGKQWHDIATLVAK